MTKSLNVLIADLKNYPRSDFLGRARTLDAIHPLKPDAFTMAAKAAGIGLRKAYGLVQIHRRFGSKAAWQARLEKIGWTRLYIAARADPEKWSTKQLLDLAEAHTAHDLEVILKGDTPPQNARVVVLRFTPEQYAVFENAVLAHGAEAVGKGLKGRERALIKALVCAP